MDLNLKVWPILVAPLIGSFLGVIVTRVEAPHAILFGRSACTSCGGRLAARDLIPLSSWLVLHGRCRSCGETISSFYPAIELAAMGVALGPTLLFSGVLVWVSCFFGWTLLALAATDLRYFLLPDFLTFPLIAAGLFATLAFDPASLTAHCIGAAAGCGFVLLVRAVYRAIRGREGIGLGDAKLLAAAGAWVSWTGLPSVIVLGSFAGLLFALRGRSLSLTNPVPFGTFLCMGTWVVWLYGPLTIG